MQRTSRVLVLFALLAAMGCRRRATVTNTSSTAAPIVTLSAPAPATAKSVAFPSSGMLCTNAIGSDSYLWSSSGITHLPPTRFFVTADGEIAEIVRDARAAKLVSRTHTELAEVPLPSASFGAAAWMAANGDVLFVDGAPTADVEVWRHGTWSKLAPPPGVTLSIIGGVVERNGAFWFKEAGEYHETSTGFTKVESDLPVLGVVDGKDGLELVRYEFSPANLQLAPLKGDAVGAPRNVGALISSSVMGSRVLVDGTSWAVYANGGAFGTVHASTGGKISELSRKSLGLVGLDGYGRVFHRTTEGFVALSQDGTTKIYPKASDPMFQLDGAWCTPLGKGLDDLPAPAAAKMGTLTVRISGARDAPVAVCPKLPGMTHCETSPERIEGRLDGMGSWTTRAPIGTYEATVQINGKWLVADLYSGKGSEWHCTLEADKFCTIELRAPTTR